MAKFYILAVKDKALDTFLRPIYAPAIKAGIRAFADECRNKENPMHQNPTDYDLYNLGTWDDETGETTPTKPELVSKATDFKPNTFTGSLTA